MRPSQFRYTLTFSAVFTAATESSQSWIVVIADSSTMSLMPAGSSFPMRCFRSMCNSTCRP